MAKIKNFRQLKVHRSSGYQYQDTPAIIMKGNWLKEYGFDSDTAINVECENGKLIITPREPEKHIICFLQAFFA